MAKSKPTHGQTLATATDPNASAASRAEALRRATGEVRKGDAQFDAVLRILTDRAEPLQVRLAALQALQAASFATTAFEPFRSNYIATLRTLTDDPSEQLRQLVLGILARASDRQTQTKLLAGLEDPDKALVPPEKALQLLSYDIHAGATDMARKIVADPPSETAKVEALRVLAADTAAVPLMARLLRDKTQTSEVRQVCAVALQGMAPRKLQGYAREIVLDQDEDKDLKALSLTALTNFGDAEALAADEQLMTQVQKLKVEAPEKVKKSARQFLKKYGE